VDAARFSGCDGSTMDKGKFSTRDSLEKLEEKVVRLEKHRLHDRRSSILLSHAVTGKKGLGCLGWGGGCWRLGMLGGGLGGGDLGCRA